MAKTGQEERDQSVNASHKSPHCKEIPEGCKQKSPNGSFPLVPLSLSQELPASLEINALAVDLLLGVAGR